MLQSGKFVKIFDNVYIKSAADFTQLKRDIDRTPRSFDSLVFVRLVLDEVRFRPKVRILFSSSGKIDFVEVVGFSRKSIGGKSIG